MTPLSVEGRRLNAGVLIIVAGEVDATNAEYLKSRIDGLHRPGQALVLDLSGLAFLDSSGLAVLIGAAERAHGAVLHLAGPHSRVRRLLEITGAWQAMTVHESVEQAIAAVEVLDYGERPKPAER
ncbi:STAS domain-containing protein [Nonomuraea polychroma]|uniref:STAS domain-containing protein n=1 Tax=Nonomuraea polychroma TaxID=46176 RepID=UPI003D91E1D7